METSPGIGEIAGALAIQEIPAPLAAAIVAAQKSASSVVKAGVNEQRGYAYATADDIARVARGALNEHGAAWVRLGDRLQSPGLETASIGNQSYVGDVVDRWMIVHESGAAIVCESHTPVIVTAARPHDKAKASSQTYGSGVTLRGALMLEREDEETAPDSREEPISRLMVKSIEDLMHTIGRAEDSPLGVVWVGLLDSCEGKRPEANEAQYLTGNEGDRIYEAAKSWAQTLAEEAGQ